jgi:hypothetical protein
MGAAGGRVVTVDFAAARADLAAFAEMVGHPLTEQQASSLQLEKRITGIVAPRQSGKSTAIGLRGLFDAYRRPQTRVLIVSAGEEAARRLLADVRGIATTSPLLRGSVVDETAGLLKLSNGSELRSVPASERQIRGWAVDRLLLDECALLSDDLILGAAFPTTSARPDARIVMASSATTATGAFYDHIALGRQGSEHVEAFAWSLANAPWIAPSVIEAARESMTPTRFAAEMEGVFASSADALYPRALLDRATADYTMPGMLGMGEHAGLAGVDWGATQDRTALVAVGRLEVPEGLYSVLCAHAWRSGEALDGPGGIIGQIADLPARFEQVSMETNGLGYPLAQSLARRLRATAAPHPELAFVTTSQASKGATYGAIRMLLEQGRLVLPASATELLRELLLLRVTLTQQGGERIEAGIGKDDLADALYLAAGPYQDRRGEWRSRLVDAAERAPLPASRALRGETVRTGGGLVLPRTPRPVRVGVVGSGFSTQPIQGGPSDPYANDAEPVIHCGEMTLTGGHHLDVGPGGKRVPPPGWTLERPRRS